MDIDTFTDEQLTNYRQSIAMLNDQFRTSLSSVYGTVILTSGVVDLNQNEQTALLEAVMSFSTFTPDNDPYQEHDFGKITLGAEPDKGREGDDYFWKIDYYNSDKTTGSENPADPNQTHRVLTIMHAHEY